MATGFRGQGETKGFRVQGAGCRYCLGIEISTFGQFLNPETLHPEP